LDPAFGLEGVQRLQVGGHDDEVRALLLLPGGELLVAGVRQRLEDRNAYGEPVAPRHEWFLARIDLASLVFDPTFGNGGLETTSFGDPLDDLFAFVPLPDGRFVAGGKTDPPDYRGDIALARYLPNGKLDASFGGQCTWGALGTR
jgi:hypothetical protein